jgi:hypothetical protein
MRLLTSVCATKLKIPRNHVPLDFGKPQLHLIQPGRVGGREVEPYFRGRGFADATFIPPGASPLEKTYSPALANMTVD